MSIQKKRNEEKTSEVRVTTEEFSTSASAAYQQIMDYIDRFQRIDAALVASNAATKINTSHGVFSVAGAIALKNRLRKSGIYDEKGAFENLLIDQMKYQYQEAVQIAEFKNKNLESQAENMRLSILGKDSKVKDDKPLEVVNTYIQENTTEIIDPLDCQKRLEELQDNTAALLTELDTQIKVSNATTTIEF